MKVIRDNEVAKVAILGVPDTPGIAAALFSALADRGVAVEMIVQSVMRGQVNDIAFLVRKKYLGEAIDVCRRSVRKINAQGVAFDSEIGKITLEGGDIAGDPDIPGRMFSVLAGESVNIDMISSAERNITCVVSSADSERAARALERAFP